MRLTPFRPSGHRARLAAGCVAGLLAACASPPPAPDANVASGADAACAALIGAMDAAVERAGTGDGGRARVRGFRTLRVDRLLASYAHPPMDAERFGGWVDAMRALDRDARAVELANLPAEVRARLGETSRALPGGTVADDTLAGRVDACAERVLALDLAVPHGRAWLVANATVPDDYRDAWRALGLYPLTGFALALGVRLYERDTLEAFARAGDPPRGTIVVHRPSRANAMAPDAIRRTVASMVAAESLPPLARVDAAALDALFASHAPDFAIDTAGPDDLPGHPLRRADGVPDVDPARPVVFVRLAWTRFDGALLPQLVYTVWFAQRPPRFAGDPLAGRLDGLVWRVTLDRDGAPLAFDTIHPCGCYHQFVPTARLASRPSEPTVEEGALVVQSLPELAAGTRVRLDLESGTHYLRRVTPLDSPAGAAAAAAAAGANAYTLEPEASLRTLPDGKGGSASLFGANGIVAGTERPERHALWISGIESPGAMRQWGRHATAFVGRRHFDDAFLLERYFARAGK
ncbi:hypothetical protein BURK1_00487 [Burkholderiales bacterium]|nr:hypothetical protein BURK1_00487 [Burkholderiales bacterium]